jgi:uncharacterized protein (TIGR02271 family)
MSRSEERLNVGTRTEETGRARLRKYVVAEQQSVQVPVTREEVRLEREPINADNYDEAVSGTDISKEEHEVTLHEEHPVVQTEAVPSNAYACRRKRSRTRKRSPATSARSRSTPMASMTEAD